MPTGSREGRPAATPCEGPGPGDASEVSARWSELRAAAEVCADAQAETLRQAACDGYEAAALTARTVAVDDLPTFQRLIGKLLAARGGGELTGASCGVTDYVDLLESRFAQFLEFVEADLARPDDTVDEGIAQLRRLLRYDAACQAQGLSDLVCDRFAEQLYPDVLDRMRAAAYADCRREGSPRTLGELLAGAIAPSRVIVPPPPPGGAGSALFGYARYTDVDLESDASWCASAVDVRVFETATDVPAELPERARRLTGGEAPGSHVTEVTVAVPPSGSLTLSGEVHAPVCADGSVPASELVVRLNGREVHRAPRSGSGFTLDSRPADLVVADLLAAAGLAGPPFDLDLRREGETCEGWSSPSSLATVHVVEPGGRVDVVVARDPWTWLSEYTVTNWD